MGNGFPWESEQQPRPNLGYASLGDCMTTQQTEPPHSIEAEQCLLGAILMNDAALDAVASVVSADDFYEPIHGFLFEHMIRAKEQGRRITLQLVGSLLSEKTKSEDIGSLTVSQYVARLAAEATTIINAPDFARVIAEDSDRRKIIEAADMRAATTG